VIVLYDQYNNPAVSGDVNVVSQDFIPDATYDGFDDEIADDFVVYGGQTWTITEVDVDGEGPLQGGFNVYFFENGAGTDLPGLFVASRIAQPASGTNGDAQIMLTPPVTLPAGSYWISVQAARRTYPGAQWYWHNRVVKDYNAALFQNPEDGFGTGCKGWGLKTACLPTQASPDQVFRLIGSNDPDGRIFAEDFETATLCSWGNAGSRYGYRVAGGGTIIPGVNDSGNHDDDASTLIALTFPYRLYDKSSIAAVVGSNGILSFESAANDFNPGCMPVAAASYQIAPYWVDQCTSPCGNVVSCPGCGIFTSTTGKFPHRSFNVEYRTVYFDSAAGSGVPLDYEVRLLEGQLTFQVVYGTINPFAPPLSRNLNIGVQLTSPSPFTLVACAVDGSISPPVSSGQVYTFTACSPP